VVLPSFSGETTIVRLRNAMGKLMQIERNAPPSSFITVSF
jgi:hypothetical protein